MADEDVQAMLSKAVTDRTFRLRLSRNFDKTVADHGLVLTNEEKEGLKAVDWGKPFGRGATAGKWVHIVSKEAGRGGPGGPGR